MEAYFTRCMVNEEPSAVLFRIMRERYSCRGYLPGQVPRATLEQLVAMAQTTPSWCNVQPWEVWITEGEATETLRAELVKHMGDGDGPDIPHPAKYEGVYQERRRACGWGLYESVGIKKGDREASAKQALKNFAFFDAPHVAVLTSAKELGPYAAIDCGVWLGHFLLGAQSLGLGAIAQAAPTACSPFLHAHLAIPADRQIVCCIALGYPDLDEPANRFRTTRAPIGESVRFVTRA